MREVGSWLVLKEFKGSSLFDFSRDWLSCVSIPSHSCIGAPLVWHPPYLGTLKLNFDGASNDNLGPSGFGGSLFVWLRALLAFVIPSRWR